MTTTKRTLRLPDWVNQRLQQKADTYATNVNSLIIQAIAQYLDVDPEKLTEEKA